MINLSHGTAETSASHGLIQGFVQVYTGDGKGKTTAALGLAFRAMGHDLKVCMILFMKGNIEYGELVSAQRMAPWIELHQMGRPDFVSKDNPAPIDIEWAQRGLALARQRLLEGQHDLLILDEINVAIDFGLVAVEDVLQLIHEKPPRMELVLTGRYAHPKILEVADLVTEMRPLKHYYDKGVPARVGIER